MICRPRAIPSPRAGRNEATIYPNDCDTDENWKAFKDGSISERIGVDTVFQVLELLHWRVAYVLHSTATTATAFLLHLPATATKIDCEEEQTSRWPKRQVKATQRRRHKSGKSTAGWEREKEWNNNKTTKPTIPPCAFVSQAWLFLGGGAHQCDLWSCWVGSTQPRTVSATESSVLTKYCLRLAMVFPVLGFGNPVA
ncbi:hypothetical protein B296_00000072 [Ensete ventricosum]|uniref:Uncharacterized protein n=1 Tax=Ensete ventricosum TaxID=4639 RepID=A0A427B614_ENSVE|nr:hypothetical protein B296_00000072 [Ensete ventricosum]